MISMNFWYDNSLLSSSVSLTEKVNDMFYLWSVWRAHPFREFARQLPAHLFIIIIILIFPFHSSHSCVIFLPLRCAASKYSLQLVITLRPHYPEWNEHETWKTTENKNSNHHFLASLLAAPFLPLCQAAAAYYNRLINENCRHLRMPDERKEFTCVYHFHSATLETHLVINHRLNRFCGFCTLQFGRFMGSFGFVLRLCMVERMKYNWKIKSSEIFQSIHGSNYDSSRKWTNNNKLNKLFGELILTIVFLGWILFINSRSSVLKWLRW